jgi:hypothetical protein
MRPALFEDLRRSQPRRGGDTHAEQVVKEKFLQMNRKKYAGVQGFLRGEERQRLVSLT